jgi:hypothetical protein
MHLRAVTEKDRPPGDIPRQGAVEVWSSAAPEGKPIAHVP